VGYNVPPNAVLPLRHIARVVALLGAAFLLSAGTRSPDALARFPRLTLWAWERPENLGFVRTGDVAVAFLARTVVIGREVHVRPRRQPLRVPPDAVMIAVVRIETLPSSVLSPAARAQTAAAIAEAARLPRVRALQIDFDATRSQRPFYRDLLQAVRQQLPAAMPLSITALASWCAGDRWMSELPIDEAVPMLFRMGIERATMLELARDAGGWREPLCRQSVGLSTDEPSPGISAPRIYLFSNRPWTAAALKSYEENLRP
jgi:hypothetical protein